jgi:DNA-binding response OmpR family regulator
MAGSGQRILVVDDDRSLRLLCRINLELEGFQVDEASTLEEARTVLRGESVAAVLLDVHVGPENGLDLLDELRAGAGPPVALLTGESGLPPEARGRADAVLSKPFAIEELTRTVERLAGSS